MNGPPEHRTVQTVIYFIGSVALILTIGSIVLVAVVLSSGRDVSPASVAILATITGLAGTSIGSLGSMLVSTRPGPAPGDPTTFTAPADASVTVEPADPAEPPDPQPVRPSPSHPPRKGQPTGRKSAARRRTRG